VWRDHLAAGGTTTPSFKPTYWKAGKNRLKKDVAGKCAYCESPCDVVAHGDVEHFRPKSRYWWLAYCFENHLFSCQICNQTHKGDQFPIRGDMMVGPAVLAATTDGELDALVDSFAPDSVDTTIAYSLAMFHTACSGEDAGLLDPYVVDPEPFFAWEADATNKEVWVRARGMSPEAQYVFSSCETTFGLNREELRRWRWTLSFQHLDRLRELLSKLQTSGAAGATDAAQIAADGIRDLMRADQPYAGMVRYFVRMLWNLAV
jgi:uncharacterized protein (TIGR02646 family)